MSRKDDTLTRHLTGKLLIASPGLGDPHFKRTVIYICAHSSEGAMGLIVNRRMPDITCLSFLKTIGLSPSNRLDKKPIYLGGPVDPERGFVLHSPDYDGEAETLKINSGFSMTATLPVLKAIAQGDGPKQSLIALGYAGWGAGQLDREFLNNGWLSVTPGPALVFSDRDATKWADSLQLMGIHPELLSATAGHC